MAQAETSDNSWWQSAPLAKPALDQRSRDLAIRTIYGEAGAEPDEGKAAVASVIKNRVDSGRFGQDVRSVVMAPNQFEPWSRTDARARMMALKPGNPEYDKIGSIVDSVWGGSPDVTKGSTHFFSPSAQSALGRQTPSWATGEPIVVGRHNFYAPNGPVQTDVSAQSRQPDDTWWKNAPLASQASKISLAGTDVPLKPDVGRGTALLRGAEQGVTANFADELSGIAAASNMSPPQTRGDVAFQPAMSRLTMGAVNLLHELFNGKGDATKRYETARDEYRKLYDEAKDQYPGTVLTGNIAGAVTTPGSAILKGATLPVRMMAGARTGAAYTGLAGIGEGTTPEDRATQGVVGTVLGGAIGAVAPPLVEGAVKGTTALFAKPLSMISAAANPKGAAERAIGRAANEAATADPAAVNRLAESELTAGAPQTVMDTLGQPGRNLARSASNLSGEATDKLNATLNPRFEGQADRFVSWLNNTFHYPNVHAQQEALDKVATTINRPAYVKAFNAPGSSAMWDEGFEQILQAPVVQQALRGAIVNARNDAAKMGLTPPRNPFVTDASGRLTLKQNPDGSQMLPSLQFWDAVKRNLDKVKTPESQFWAKTLRDHADELVPDYGVARAGAAKFFKADNALEAGQNFVELNFGNQQTRAALAKMNPLERQLFQDGFVSRYMEMLNAKSDRADVVKQIYNSPAAREKIQIAIGPVRAKELEAMIRIEGIMQQGLRAVQGNSTTAAQLVGVGLAGATGGGVLGYDPTTSGVLAALLTAGKRGVDKRVANHIADMLMSKDPAVLQKGIRVVASNPTLMNALRSADAGAIRIGNTQVPTNMPALQAPAVSRAQDEPAVPRPPAH